MSLLSRFLAWLRSPAPNASVTSYTDRFTPRDWADLPVHHPRCD